MADAKNGPSDKEVDKARSDVEKLRDQVEEAKLDLLKAEAARNNGVVMATLDAEKDRLKAELAQLNEAVKVSQAPVSEDPVVQQIEANAAGTLPEDAAADSKEK